ncbi:uncharacterized protein LOC108629732 [Ceratina calcarata]|uniref:Uncharacterized protein LOC108629732 n=1 Tax=Ceratina calcarata TaxID=156304 RepID=A0AAJ7WEM0_9HYME|nr:uncharacterized protein LOC108629732 [Ceratina calcarata]
MTSYAFVLLVLFSGALSRSATNHETLDTTTKLPDSRNDIRNYEKSEEPIETLFIPEDPNRYKEILLHVRELFEPVGESIEPFDRSSEGSSADNAAGKNRFSMTTGIRERNRNPQGKEDEEKYLERNLGEEVFPVTTAEDNGRGGATPLGINKYNDSYAGKKEPDEEDVLEAAYFGLNAMKDLYTVKEPMLYYMGLYLGSDNPARHVAVFNDQTEEARTLAKYGFAVLQGTAMFKKKFPDASTDLLLSRRSQSNPLHRGCPNRGVPDCPPASFRYRTSDGSCNNLQHLWWGSAMSTMQRYLPPVYDDGIQSVRKSVTGAPLPSARLVSAVIHEDKDVPLASVTHMLMQWGQFVDHDITATGQSRGFNGSIPQCCLNFGTGFQPPEFTHPECLPIPVSAQDNFFGPLGVRCLEFARSGPAPKEDCVFGPREQLSQVTSYLDASTVYSSNAFHTDALRLFRNGLLQYGKIQSHRPVLPKLDPDLCKRGSLSTSCFRAGDGRLGEQPALTSLHVAFLRLHNRIATKLAALNAHWSDEKLFQESRRIVAAVVQHITYREFLPIVLGQDVMKIFDLELLKKGYFDGYDPAVNPTIANEFSTAAYRFGHSLVQSSFVRYDSNHQPIFNNVSIHNELTNPANLETAGSVDRLLLGLINQPSQRRDEHVSEELTNHLFQTPSFPFGMDLASINIQRGRDHGIPPYVQWRVPCGLSPIRSFEDLETAMPPSTARKFKLVYSAVEDIDLFTAGLAEKSVKGGLVGPTFACIIGQQFNNLRRGDRFWYENSQQENSFTPGQLQQIRRVTLAQVLCTTMDDIETVQPFVFLTADTLKNQRLPCNDPVVGQLNLEFWAEGSAEVRSRAGILDQVKKKISIPGLTTPKPVSTTEEGKFFYQSMEPPKASVLQKNRIVVKRPIGTPDNVTIVVQNNAINSPVFVNDAIHGSMIRINPSLNQKAHQPPIPEDYLPGPKPIPTTHPLASINRPYAFRDPNDPNPLHQGFLSGHVENDVIFEHLSGSSPRPTLYTYYTNFQKMTTQRPPHEVDMYLVNYKPQGQASRPNSWIEPQYESQSKPHYGSSENQHLKPVYDAENERFQHNSQGYGSQNHLPSRPSYIENRQPSDNQEYQNHKFSKPFNTPPHSNQGYGTNTWQKVQYQQSSYNKKQQDVVKDSGNGYTTWSSVSPDKNTIDRVTDQQIYLISPPYQSSNKPTQTVSTYQREPTKPSIDHNSYISSSTRPSLSQFDKNPNIYDNQHDYGNAFHQSTPVYKPGYQTNRSPEAYQTLTRPKPSKIHSVTIVTEPSETMSQAEIDRVENRVTSEIPRPLISQAGNNGVRRPGQYYYEKNVLHRYPESQTERYNGEERHKQLSDISLENQSTFNNESSADIDATVNQTRYALSDSADDDDVDRGVGETFLGNGAPRYRTSHWLNPQEDSSLPSAPEVPKIPSDKTAAARELPKPIKFRYHGS